MLGRIVRLAIVGWIASMIAATIGALSVKRRLAPTTDESANEIVAVGIFGPLAFHSTARQFRGGQLECWYGGGVLDLRDAELAPEGATRNVRTVFGGGQIVVPPSWKVVTRVRGMGGIQDVRPSQGHSAMDPELVIEGLLIAGGFVVTSELMDDEASWDKGLSQKTAELATKAEESEPKPKPSVDADAPSAEASTELTPTT